MQQQQHPQDQPQKPMCLPSPYSLPATTSRSYRIMGVDTHTFCQVFADRIVVGITQLESRHIGHWILCQASRSAIDPRAIDYEVTTVLGNTSLGNRNDSSYLYEVYGRRLTESIIEERLVPGSDRMVVLLGISLTPPSPSNEGTQGDNNSDMERFRCVVNLLVNDLIRSALMKVAG